MIPKIIHYCWFGRGRLPRSAKKCIKSWKKFLPDYAIKVWNEDNFDVNCIQYTKEAYAAKKYAFVSDYARFKILYEHGGLYFDTDVEVIRPLDKLLENGAFMGMEEDPVFLENGGLSARRPEDAGMINPGLGLAVAPGLGLYKDILDMYAGLKFIRDDGTLDTTTVVRRVTDLLLGKGMIPSRGVIDFEGVKIYPSEYFCPMSWRTQKLVVTPNTYTIHWYTASWWDARHRTLHYISNHYGPRAAYYVGYFWRPFPVVVRSLIGAVKRRVLRVIGFKNALPS